MLAFTRYFFAYLLFLIVSLASFPALAIQLHGETTTHDPSTIVEDDGVYWTFGTGNGTEGMVARYSTDLINWKAGSTVFPIGTWPNWINARVPGFSGNFWAPDLIKMNGRYYIYYSAFSGDQPPTSAIGVAVTDSLNHPNWRDLGMIVSTQTDPRTAGGPMNAIDPGVYRDTSGNVWMIYGSHYSGLYIIQIDPKTGLRRGNARYQAIGNGGNWSEFEGAQVQYIDGYYYAFVNRGDCCAGRDSNYYILVGRSTSPTGPFLDRNGVNLWNYGSSNGNANAASTVLKTDGRYIGPGHFGFLERNGQRLVSIHYYDGNTANGWPSRLDLLELKMVNGWPTFTRNFKLNDEPVSSSSSSVNNSNQLANGRYTIVARHSGKAIEVANASNDDGANIQQWRSTGGLHQQFDVTRQASGVYHIVAASSGKALDVYEWSTEPGGNIVQWEYWGGEPQEFNIVPSGAGYYEIRSVFSGLALDVSRRSQDDGANISQWTPNGATNQQWSFQPVTVASSSSRASLTPSSSSKSSLSSKSSSSSLRPSSRSSLAASSSSAAPSGSNCSGVNEYPNWTAKDWSGGSYNHADGGDRMVYQNTLYQANWYTRAIPGADSSWTRIGACGTVVTPKPESSSSSRRSSSSVPSSSSPSSVGNPGNNTGSGIEIVVRMRGFEGDESVNLVIGGTTIETWTLSTRMENYSVRTSATGDILVEFTNDSGDRDVEVDYIVVDGDTRQAEDQQENTGAYDGECGGGSYSQMLHCNGYINFSSKASPGTGSSGLGAVEFSRQMGVGWNLGNSLEAMGPGNEMAWGNAVVTQRLISAVKAAGFKTIRIPVAWSDFSNARNYTIDRAWLNRVEEVVNYALNENMYVVINEHWDGGWLNFPFYNQQASLNDRLQKMWTQIATHFRDYDHRLLFAGTNEVMNEGDYGTPSKEFVDVQNSFNQTFVNTVRATGGKNADRYLVVQSFNTNIDHAFEFAKIPTDSAKNRLFMEVHYYDPYNFTLNQSSGVTTWPSSAESWANESWVDGQMRKMKTRFVDKGVAVLLGEYGVITRAGVANHEQSRIRWNKYVTESAIANGIVPVYWDNGVTSVNDNGMGLFDRSTGRQVYPDLIKAIVNAGK